MGAWHLHANLPAHSCRNGTSTAPQALVHMEGMPVASQSTLLVQHASFTTRAKAVNSTKSAQLVGVAGSEGTHCIPTQVATAQQSWLAPLRVVHVSTAQCRPFLQQYAASSEEGRGLWFTYQPLP